MAFTYNLAENRGKVRLIITDTDSTAPIFQDDEIDAFISIGGGILLAAAYALDTIASNEALVLKVIRLLDLSTDGRSVASALREHAKTLREQVDGEASFDWAEMVLDDFSYRELVWKEGLRGA